MDVDPGLDIEQLGFIRQGPRPDLDLEARLGFWFGGSSLGMAVGAVAGRAVAALLPEAVGGDDPSSRRAVVLTVLETRTPTGQLFDAFDPSQGMPPAVGLSPEEIGAVLAAERAVRINDNSDGTGCVICREDWTEGVKVVPLPHCGHCMHPACIVPWLELNRTCPCCRAPTATGTGAGPFSP